MLRLISRCLARAGLIKAGVSLTSNHAISAERNHFELIGPELLLSEQQRLTAHSTGGWKNQRTKRKKLLAKIDETIQE